MAAGPSSLEAWFAGAGVVLVLAGAAGFWAAGPAFGVTILAAGYVAGLYAGGRSLDVAAAPFGACLLMAAELAQFSLELGAAGSVEGALTAARLTLLGAVCVGSAAAGLVFILPAAEPLPGGLAATAAGLLAAVAAVALLAWLARRPTGQDPS